MTAAAIGVDIGGTGIKLAIVDVATPLLLTERIRTETPESGAPGEIIAIVRDQIQALGSDADGLPIGVALPSVVRHGVTQTAANIAPAWIGLNARAAFSEALGRDMVLLNDADAAGWAECSVGAARGQVGVTMVITLGTGIGSAIISDGHLVPNTELGHLDVGDVTDYERYASTVVREREGLSYEQWAPRLERYFRALERLFSPDLFVVGGGVSKQSDRFLPLLNLRTPIVPATFRNNAGIIGAASYAALAARHNDAGAAAALGSLREVADGTPDTPGSVPQA